MPFDHAADDDRGAPPPSDRLWRHPSEFGPSAPTGGSGRGMRLLATVAVIVGAVLVVGAYLGPRGVEDVDRPVGDPADTRLAVATTAVRLEGGGGRLGVRVVDAPDDAGAEVVDLDDGGAAATAGLVAGDVVLAIDGEAVRGAEDLAAVIATHDPGDTVIVEFERDGSHEVDATLD